MLTGLCVKSSKHIKIIIGKDFTERISRIRNFMNEGEKTIQYVKEGYELNKNPAANQFGRELIDLVVSG